MDKIEQAKQAHKASGEAGVMLRIARGLITAFITGIGITVSAMLASLAYPEPAGVGALMGGVFGAVLFGTIGCCASGAWRDVFSFDLAEPSFIPHSVYSAVGKHGDFTLILTVHNVDDFIQVSNRFVNRAQLFVEIACGDNPVKQTCVNPGGVFEEQFKLDVKAADSSLVLTVKDQSLFGADTVGYVSLDIQKDIVEKSEPGKAGEYIIEGSSGYTISQPDDDKKKAKLHLSFQTPDIDGQTDADREASVKHAQSQWNEKGYGAVDFLPAFAFNTTTTLNFNAAAKENEQQV